MLTASEGTWSVPLTKTAYQWQRCAADGSACVNIAGATAKTYTPVVADIGKTLVVAGHRHLPGPDRDRRERRRPTRSPRCRSRPRSPRSRSPARPPVSRR